MRRGREAQRLKLLWLCAVAALSAACVDAREHDDDGNVGTQLGTLTILPGDAMRSVDGKTPLTIAYRVKLRGEDVTDQATLTVDDTRLGYFQGATFTSQPGAAGKTLVRAQLGPDSGATPLTLRVKAVVIAPGAPPNAPDRFGGSGDARRAPEIAYPPAGALMPPNLNELEFHFVPKDAALFELSVLGDALDLKIYTTCKQVGSGCVYLPDEPTWQLLSQGARGRSVEVTMRGTGAEGGGVGTSQTQTLSFSDNDMKGGLYYWAASTGGINRYDFGLRGQKAESFYDPLRAGLVTCVGCHALSRNGQRIAVGMNIPGPAQMRALDTATRSRLFEIGTGVPLGDGSNFQAFSPDGQWLITSEKGGLAQRQGTSGLIFGKVPAIPDGTMPDFSPDGKTVVFARNKVPCPLGPLCLSLGTIDASLYIVPFKGVDGFGAPTLLSSSGGANFYYPSFSPDGRFVAFNRAAGESYDAPDARVMVVAADGSRAPVDLGAVNASLGNSWVKWSPFIHRFGGPKGPQIMWLTFSSRRPYGVRPTPAAQIWMVPVAIDKLDAGQDSGYPPFRLPFQDLNTGNHIPQWVEKVDRAPCSKVDMTGCSAGEQCVDGACIPVG